MENGFHILKCSSVFYFSKKFPFPARWLCSNAISPVASTTGQRHGLARLHMHICAYLLTWIVSDNPERGLALYSSTVSHPLYKFQPLP